MKSVVICEGNTDLVLIQYFLERVYSWEYIDKGEHANYEDGVINKIKTKNVNDIKWFAHNNGSILCIVSAGGVDGIPTMLNKILDLNKLGTVKQFDRIAIISDRDEITTEQEFIAKLYVQFSIFNVNFTREVLHNDWNCAKYLNDKHDESEISFLPLIIPFEDTGAIEIFLLEAICDNSEKYDPLKIDKHVIRECLKFIDNIDCKGKYLTRRREKTKAKFDTAFVVMTPAEAFHQRQTLLRSVPWEQYEHIQDNFRKLNVLSQKL